MHGNGRLMVLFITRREIVRKEKIVSTWHLVECGAGNVLFLCVLQMHRFNSRSVPGVNNAHVNLSQPRHTVTRCQTRDNENFTRSTQTFKWIPIRVIFTYCILLEKHRGITLKYSQE